MRLFQKYNLNLKRAIPYTPQNIRGVSDTQVTHPLLKPRASGFKLYTKLCIYGWLLFKHNNLVDLHNPIEEV